MSNKRDIRGYLKSMSDKRISTSLPNLAELPSYDEMEQDDNQNLDENIFHEEENGRFFR